MYYKQSNSKNYIFKMKSSSFKAMAYFAMVFISIGSVSSSQPVYEFINEDSIPELKYLDTTVDPCDNFYQYTCGNFKNVQPLPEGKYNWDHFTILQEEIHQLMKVILESERKLKDPVALQKAKAAYGSCIDTDYADQLNWTKIVHVDKLGVWPLLEEVQGEAAPLSFNEIGDVVANYGVPLFFNYQILPNYYNSSENMIYIYRDALSNPQTYYGRLERNLDEYLDVGIPTSKSETIGRTREENVKEIVLPFEQFLRTIALHLRNKVDRPTSYENIKADISETIQFMRILQSGGILNEELSTSASITTVEQLQSWTDELFGETSIDWLDYLNHLFAATGVTIASTIKVMYTPKLIYGVLKLYGMADARILRNFVMVRLLTYMAPDSDAVMREAFDTYYRNQNYEVFPRWQYCLRKILGYPDNVEYSMALTYEYQRFHFNVNKLASAADMINDLQDAFKDILIDAEWIDDVTREQALLKLENMITLLGYPDYAEDSELLDEYYDRLRVCTWEHFGNSQRGRSFKQTLNFELIGAPRNREIWALSPLEVNAFYNRDNNRILFPVSMLNGVFFSGDVSALDYSRIGAVIGHEITHGYDNEGRSRNKEGTVTNWWSKETEEAFNERTECFKEQYARYYIEEIGVYVNASVTLNENLADNGGLRQAYRALQKLLRRSSSIKTVKNFSPEQLFFIGYGTMWCMTETPYYLQQMYLTNSYAPGRYRVIGTVSNMEEFAEAFNCPVGSNMNPEKKCILW